MSTPTTDLLVSISQLIEESRNGNRDAFGQLVERFQGVVASVTLSMTGDLQLSEDIAQETFLKAWTKLGELRDSEKVGGWLCSIARNLCRDTLAQKTRKPLRFVSEMETPQGSETTNEETRTLQNEAMLAALQRIPEKYRQPLVLFYRENLLVREIAATLELSEDAVKQRLSRGRKYLRDEAEKMFQELLRATRPGSAFMIAVLASLPVLHTVSQAAASTLGVGSAVAAGGSTAASTGKGFGLLTLGAVLLNIIYPALLLIWAPLSVRKTLKYAPTLRIRRFGLRNAMFVSTSFWTFAALALSTREFWDGSLLILFLPYTIIFLIPLFLHYCCYLALLSEELQIFLTDEEKEKCNKNSWFENIYFKSKAPPVLIRDRDTTKAAKPYEDNFGNISLAPKTLWRWFYATVIITVPCMLICAERTYRLMLTDEDFLAWKLVCGIALISYILFFSLLVRGIRSSQDRESFVKTAPSMRRLKEYKKQAFGDIPPPMKQQLWDGLRFLVTFPIFCVFMWFAVPYLSPLLSQAFWSPFFGRIVMSPISSEDMYPIEKRVLQNGIQVWYLYDSEAAEDFKLISLFPGGNAFGPEYTGYADINRKRFGFGDRNSQNGAFLDNIPFYTSRKTSQWKETVSEIRELFEKYGSYMDRELEKRRNEILDDLNTFPLLSSTYQPNSGSVRSWTFAAWSHFVAGHESVALREAIENMTPERMANGYPEPFTEKRPIILCGIGGVLPQKFFEEIETQFESLELDTPLQEQELRNVEPGQYSMKWDVAANYLMMMFKIPDPEESPQDHAAMLYAAYSMRRNAYYFQIERNSQQPRVKNLEIDTIKLPEGHFLFLCARPVGNHSLQETEELIETEYLQRIQTQGEIRRDDLRHPSPLAQWLPLSLEAFSVRGFVEDQFPIRVEPDDDSQTIQRQRTAYRWAHQQYIYGDENVQKSVLDACERVTAAKVIDAAKKYLTPENAYSLRIIGVPEKDETPQPDSATTDFVTETPEN